MRMLTGAAMAATALLLAPTGQAEAQDFRWSGRLAPGKTVTIRGVNGAIRGKLATGNEVLVTAQKQARRSDPAQVTVEVLETASGVVLCAVYPGRDDGRANRCGEGDDYRMNTRDNDVSVAFTVEVPAGVHLVAKTVNGEIEATGLRGDIHAATVNGGVEVSTSGLARASTVNGSVRVDMGRSDWTGDWALETVNGGVEVRLPASTAARVEASTVNGDIETDFPLTVNGRFGPRRLRGTINGGGDRSLTLSTVNGEIAIRRGG